MKAIFIHSKDPQNRMVVSGIINVFWNVLTQQFKFKWVHAKDSWLVSLNRILVIIWARVCGQGYSTDHLYSISKSRGRQLTTLLAGSDADFIFAPLCSEDIAFLKTEIPIIYFSDATIPALVDYYPQFVNMNKSNKKQAMAIEKMAVTKAAHCFFASQWALDSAVENYNLPRDKVSVLHFGPNMKVPIQLEPKELNLKKPLQILFVGVDPIRKGVDIAVQTVGLLNEKFNISAELTVVGLTKDQIPSAPWVKPIGFLDKNNPEQALILECIYRKADLFILPTRAECAGIVFVEASAFGLPCISRSTGGIPDYIEQGVNGYLIAAEAGAEEYAKTISKLIETGQYNQISLSARQFYEKKYTSDVFLDQFINTINKMTFKDQLLPSEQI